MAEILRRARAARQAALADGSGTTTGCSPGEYHIMKVKTKRDRRHRIRLRARKRLVGTGERPRLTVFRSLAHTYVQVVDDQAGRTVAATSSRDPSLKAQLAGETRGSNKAGAEAVGRAIAEKLLAKQITRVVFDRGGFLYHGRVRAIADAARKAGLEF